MIVPMLIAAAIIAAVITFFASCAPGGEAVSPAPTTAPSSAPPPTVVAAPSSSAPDAGLPAELYARLIVEPAFPPVDCAAPGDTPPTPAQLRAFEAELARAIREDSGLPPEALATASHDNAEIAQLATEFAFEIALEESAEVADNEVRAMFDADPERFARPDVAYFDFFFHPARGDEPHADLLELAEMASAGASLDDVKRQAALLGITFSERSVRGVRGRLMDSLERAVFSAPEEEFSPPVRVDNGWQLLYVHQVRPGTSPDFEESAPRIRRMLVTERMEELRSEWLAENPDPAAHVERHFRDRAGWTSAMVQALVHHETITAYLQHIASRDTDFTNDEMRAFYDEYREHFVGRTQHAVLEAQVPLPPAEDYASAPAHRDAMVALRQSIMVWADALAAEGRTLADLEPGETPFPIRVVDQGTDAQGPRGVMLDRAVENLEVGEFSLAQPGREFFHLYQLTARIDPRPLSFDEARSEIERGLRLRGISEAYETLACAAWLAVVERE